MLDTLVHFHAMVMAWFMLVIPLTLARWVYWDAADRTGTPWVASLAMFLAWPLVLPLWGAYRPAIDPLRRNDASFDDDGFLLLLRWGAAIGGIGWLILSLIICYAITHRPEPMNDDIPTSFVVGFYLVSGAGASILGTSVGFFMGSRRAKAPQVAVA